MSHELDSRSQGSDHRGDATSATDPGKRTMTSAVQRRNVQRASATPPPAVDTSAIRNVQFAEDPFGMHLQGSDQVHAAAARGIATPTTSMPHADAIQRSFGPDHDVSGIKAHVGGGAADATRDMGATAFASGDHVAFAGQPDLHTAAHEAAHVVQQAQGVNLLGGVGDAGDVYERHADAVADRVVAGQSAAELLTAGPTGGGTVQRKIAAPIVQHRVVQREGEGTGGDSGKTTTTTTTTTSETKPESKPEVKPDPNAKVAKLHLYIDVDVKELGIKDLMNGSVGHTWIALEYVDTAKIPDTVPTEHKTLLANGGKYADPMGFWPDTQNGVYYNPNPFKSWVDGWMRHPDRAHEGSEKAIQTWELTQAEVDKVIRYAESKRGAQYSVYFYNCTTFGKEAVAAAGKSPPSMSTGGICFPNAAYNGIKERQKKGVGNTTVTDLDNNTESTVNGPDSRKG